MSNALPLCPVCSGALEITEGSCRDCNVQVRGHFAAGRYQALTPEQATFLEAFLRCRGVIRDIEATLGISYPTVKSRLESTLAALGLQGHPLETPREIPEPPQPAAQPHEQTERREPASPSHTEHRRMVLEAVQRGEITTEEGLRKLRG